MIRIKSLSVGQQFNFNGVVYEVAEQYKEGATVLECVNTDKLKYVDFNPEMYVYFVEHSVSFA